MEDLPMSPVVIVVVSVVALGLAAGILLARKGRGKKPAGPDIGGEIKAMAANVGIQWAEIYERLNPGGDPAVKQELDEFRLSGYQVNSSLGLNVIEAAYDALLAEVDKADRSQITLHDVLCEAAKQHKRVTGRWQ